jgi:hypothetical protein
LGPFDCDVRRGTFGVRRFRAHRARAPRGAHHLPLRSDGLGAYGYPLPTSPEVDRFAREVGVGGGNRFYMLADVKTIAEVVFDGAVATGAVVSHWVLRRPTRSRGDVGVAQGFVHFDDEMQSAKANRDAFERNGSVTTDATIRWLDKQKRANTERVFLLVHYQDPHGPYSAALDTPAASSRRRHPSR